MILFVLEFEYKVLYTTAIDGSPEQVNCVMRRYNPRVESIYIYDGDSALPVYLYLSSDHSIQHLSARIQGRNTAGKTLEIGLLEDKPEAKLYNVTFQTDMKDVNFAVVRRSNRILIIDSFFKVAAGSVSLDTAFFTICTRCTFTSLKTTVGEYLLADSLIRENFTTTKAYLMKKRPAKYVLGCRQCIAAADGDQCQQCRGDTFKDSDGCTCLYQGYSFQNFTEECSGQDEIVTNDAIMTADNHTYTIKCRSRLAYQLNVTYSASKATNFSVFDSDSCGINNIKISGTLAFHSATEYSLLSGLVLMLTSSITNITSSLVITHTGQVLERAAAICAITQPGDSFMTVMNITLSGSMSLTGGLEENNPADYRNAAGIIARVEDSKVNISGIAINGFTMEHTAVMRGFSFFVGSSINATINAFDLLVVPLQQIRGYINLNIDGLDITAKQCNENIENLRLKGSLIIEELGDTFYKSGEPQPFVQSDAGHRIALGFAQNIDSIINITRVYISAYVLGTNSNNWECGLLAADVNSTILNATDIYINGSIRNGNSYHGVIARVNKYRDNSIVNLTMAGSITIERHTAGIIAYQDSCISELQLYVNLTTESSTSGVYGWINGGGSTSISGLFGNIQVASASFSAKIVGRLDGSSIDGFTCSGCSVHTHKANFIGAQEIAGMCDNTYIYITSPILMSNNNYYFIECMSDTKIKIQYSYYFNSEGVEHRYSTFENSACTPRNLEIQVDYTFTGYQEDSNCNVFLAGISMETETAEFTNLKFNLTASFINGYMNRVTALTNDQMMQCTITNIVLTGSVSSNTVHTNLYSAEMCGLTCWLNSPATYQRIRIIGFKALFSYGCRSAFIAGHLETQGTITLEDLIIDDNTADASTSFTDDVYSQDAVFPCFGDATEDLKIAMRAKNLLKANNPIGRSSFQATAPSLNASGMIFGALDGTHDVFLSKVAVIGNYSVTALYNWAEKRNVGMIAGELKSGTNLNIRQMFISGNIVQTFLGMFGPMPAGVTADIIIAAEGDWSGESYKGLFSSIDGGSVTIRIALNISLNALYSGGVVGQFFGGTLTVQEAVGKVSDFGITGGERRAFELVGEYKPESATITGYDNNQAICEDGVCSPVNQCTTATQCKINQCSP